MGKCPERLSPSPPAVVGTFPYNLLNGTASKETAGLLYRAVEVLLPDFLRDPGSDLR